ncbi:MAG: 3-hydroxyacyl-ACP dehydratase [Bacteroidales bacterium]|nr:3-hydroxyacyl-ACP dehydratase [Bacteroidales bacterium]
MKVLGEMFLLEGWQETEKGFLCRLQANPGHEVYRAHFPSQPVTPGVCIIQLAGELLASRLQRELYLKAVKNAKFLALVLPEDGKRIIYQFDVIEQTADGCRTQLVVRDEGKLFAKLSLVYIFEPL